MVLGKHFINGVNDPVERALITLLRHDDALRLIQSDKVLFRQTTEDKVILLSGGGSGHEPAHAGYVGEGMLDIAVAGNVFASPSASQILTGLGALESKRGVLMIVKAYTGDILNFGLAAEKAKADGKKIDFVIVADDVSTENNTLVRPRGLAGVSLVHKIAGAAAAQGWSLEEVTRVAQKTANSVATMGVSLDRCSVPQRQKQEGLPLDEFEYGMGIHNEPGAKRSHISSLNETVSVLLSTLSKERAGRWFPVRKDKVAVMVNNLGGLSVLEMNVIADEVTHQLELAGITISRLFVGPFVTSLDAPGFSITLLKLDSELEGLLDAPTSAPAWQVPSNSCHSANWKSRIVQSDNNQFAVESGEDIKIPISGELLAKVIESINDTVTRDEPTITKYDTIAGDGDCGETLLNGVNSLSRELAYIKGSTVDLSLFFRRIASLVEKNMGGTSGALYAIFFNAVSCALSRSSPQSSLPDILAIALQSGLKELCKYTTARKGHRTLMDALIPFVETFSKSKDLKAAVDAATKGAESTRDMEALLGRASYVSKDEFEREGGIPDPGSIGVASVVRGTLSAIS